MATPRWQCGHPRKRAVMPDQAAVACIHGPHVIRGTKIQDAVHFERSGFEYAPRSAKNPRQRERPYISTLIWSSVLKRLLNNRRCTSARRPLGGFSKGSRVEALCAQIRGQQRDMRIAANKNPTVWRLVNKGATFPSAESCHRTRRTSL